MNMMLCVRIAIALALVLTFCVLAPASRGFQEAGPVFSTPEQLKEDLVSVPCEDKDRLSAAQALFRKMGAPEADIAIDKFKNVENLVVRKPGMSEEKIIIGAHYDKTPDGCGAVDNWTGVVALAHIYRTFRSFTLKKTLVFVAFGKEEKGLIGSGAMADGIQKDQIAQYCAMVNIDSLGLGAPQVAANLSSNKLTTLAADLAKRMKMPFGQAPIEYADADSSSFLRKKIPAITLHGLTNEWASVLHSSKDQPAKVNPASVYLGYRLALALVNKIDASACDAYR